MTDFYFVRHGQTAANAAGLKQGQINSKITQLSKVGISQVTQLHKNFAIGFADRIIASPLDRTVDTANILNQNAKLPFSTDQRLLEISYGKWDGKKNSDLKAAHPEVFDEVLNDVLPSYQSLADGETFENVIRRVVDFMNDNTKKHPDEKIILATHGFTIKAAVLGAVNVTNQADMMSIQEPDNASVTKITHDAKTGKYYVKYYNRTVTQQF